MAFSRERVAGMLKGAHVLGAVLRMRKLWPGTPLTILTYHSVAERALPGLDEGVVDATPEQFDFQMGFVRRHFQVVGIDDVAEAVAGRARLPANPLLITFDDGYRSCLDTALPILLRWGLRATFFIATDYTERRRLFWWDRVSYLLTNSRVPEIASRLSDAQRESLAHIKETPGLDIEEYLTNLADVADVDWNEDLERRFADQVMMTWDDIRTLRAAGMDIQSHTRSHRVLQTLDAEQLRDELTGSRKDLETKLGEPIRAVAYPVGHPIVHSQLIRTALEDAGYELGFSNATGVNYRVAARDRYDLRRLAVDRDASNAMFAGSLAIPPLAYTR